MAQDPKQTQQLVMVAMISVGFLYGYFTYMLKPVREDMAKINGELTQTLQKVESLKAVAVRLERLKAEKAALESEVGEAEKRLPRETNLHQLIIIVADLAKKYNIFIPTFSPGREAAQTYYVEYPIELTFAGTAHNLGRFLTALGQQERIITARNVRMQYALNEKKGFTVSGGFTLLAYMFRG